MRLARATQRPSPGALGVVTQDGPEVPPAGLVFDRRVGVDNTRTL